MACCCHNDHLLLPTSRRRARNWRRALWIALGINAGMLPRRDRRRCCRRFRIASQADALDFLGDAANYAISLGVAGMAHHLAGAGGARRKAGTLAILRLRPFWPLPCGMPMQARCPAPRSMGVVGVAALLANGGVALDALPLPQR